jgi:hypothetical protein
MKRRTLASLGLLLLASVTLAQGPTPQPWQPSSDTQRPGTPPAGQAPRVGKDGRSIRLVDGVPDTGQFLPDSTVIARIDNRSYRVGEFREDYFKSLIQYRPRPDSAGRAELLTSVVNKEILAALARQVNRPLTFEDRTTLREHRERVFSNVAFARMISDSTRIPMAELRRVYAQRLFSLHVQRIVTPDRASAERARADLQDGRLDWEQAVAKYSTRRGDQGPDGEIGWVKWNAFPPEVALQVFDLKDGQFSAVHQDADGWQVVRVAGRRPDPQPPFERMAVVINNDLMPGALERRVEQVRARLRPRIGLAYDSTNIAWAANQFRVVEEQSQAASASSSMPNLDLTGAMPEVQPADTSRVLAHWRDGRMSLGAFLEEYNAIEVLRRPRVGSFEAFRTALDGFVLEPTMAQLALERGYDRDPWVTGEMARKEEMLRVDHLFADSMNSKVSITPAERRKYYEEHKPGFITWQNVTYAILLRKSKAGADSLAARLAAGETAAGILRADSLAGLVAGAIRTMREDERGAKFYPLLFEELKPGNVHVTGPDRDGDYILLQKLSHEPGRQLSYQEVSGLVDESLQNLKAQQLLEQLIARHRPGHQVELRLDLLMRIRLTDPILD